MVFVDREDELASLERWWALPNGRIGLLWGRRRVGKTALLQRFAATRRHIDVLAITAADIFDG